MRFTRRLVTFAAAITLAIVPLARAATPGAPGVVRAPIKQLQVRMLAAEPMRERAEKRERARELRRMAKRMRHEGRSSLQVRGERARPFIEDEDARAGTPRPILAASPQSTHAVAGPPRANQRCNDVLGDGALDGQCETSIARWNNYLVAAWNDGTGFTDGSNQTQGWATSVDGGVTWIDQGKFPLPSGTWVWSSDPVVAVNSTTGAFYFAALGDASPTQSAIGVLKGRFNGSAFTWGTLSTPRSVASSNDFLDKEWIAVDAATGKVCLTYSEFLSGLSRIEFQYADSALTSWSGATQVSLMLENGAVQGSRPAFGASGSIYVVYYLIGNVDVDYYRICHSLDGGQTFSTPVDAVSFYSNFGTGAPGFNREMGIQFPSIAVDLSGGPHDGRIYLSWAESLNWYNDGAGLGVSGRKSETEINDAFTQANSLALGQTASGSVNSLSDIYDWWALPLAAGQTVIVQADTVGSGASITMRMFAPDGATRLAFGIASSSDILAGYQPVWIYTAPTTGTYYLRIAALTGSGVYRVSTGAGSHGSERGRDQRDAFVAYSDNGTAWNTPVRVSNSPVGYDEWLPEVAVTRDGTVYCAWYDWRDAPASTSGGESSVYLARSIDGGANWSELGATSDARTAWTAVQTNIVPNEGDYLSLSTDATGVTVAWSDGRGGTPDIYMSYWSLSEASTLPALVSATVVGGQVQLKWNVGTPAGFAAELYRRTAGSATYDSLGTILSDAAGLLQYTDAQVQVGATYDYRLGVMQGGTEYFYGQVRVTLTGFLALAGAWPNPVSATSVIAFTLASTDHATLDLVDLNGRRIYSWDVGSKGPGPQSVALSDAGRLRPGVYFTRLTQGRTHHSKRIVVL